MNVCVEASPLFQSNVDPVLPGSKVSEKLEPAQYDVSLPKITTGNAFSVMALESVPSQPLASVTVTEYVPASVAVNVCVDASPLFQSNVDPVLPASNISEKVEPAQYEVSLPKITTGNAFSVMVLESVPSQPLASVTVTEYVPASVAVNVCVEAAPLFQSKVEPVLPASNVSEKAEPAQYEVSFPKLTTGKVCMFASTAWRVRLLQFAFSACT